MPKPMRIVPEILLITDIVCKVNLFRSLPAISTLKISAAIFNARQTIKITMRCRNEYLNGKVVAVPSQKIKTFGLSVFIRKPDENILAISLFRNRRNHSLGTGLQFDFFKEHIKYSHQYEKATSY